MDPAAVAPPPPLRAHLFGTFRLDVGGEVVSDRGWPRRSARSLLLLLLITPAHRLPRDQVLDLLWPDLPPRSADSALRKAVHALRRTLQPELRDGRASAFVDVGADTVALHVGTGLWIDIDAFEAALATARGLQPEQRRPHLRRAVDLYEGDLLSSDPYLDWANATRQRFRVAHRRAVLELAELDRAAGDPAATIPSLERLLEADHTDEGVLRTAMRALALCGRRDDAMRWYRHGIDALRLELDTEPEKETRDLADAIDAMVATPAVPLPTAIAIRRQARIPAPPNALVGRVRDVEGLLEILLDREVRLVTVTGPGGVGKTRLAQEAARQVSDDFSGGVCFVALATVRDAEMVLPTIARALGIAESPAHTPAEMVQAALQERDLLLVLDNVEQVLDAAPAIATLLEECERLTILATSREALRLRAEHEMPLPPLSVPDSRKFGAPHIVARFEAVELFLRRARAVDPGFVLTQENTGTVAGICRRLDGLPLAIELAAAQARTLSPEQLLAGLADRFALLTGGYRDLPPRQQSLHDAIRWSYHLLTPSRQTLFRYLAVFAGGFTIEAAIAVIQAETGWSGKGRSMTSLVNHGIGAFVAANLLRQEDDDAGFRYTMLESIQEFALGELMAAGEGTLARTAHAGWVVARAEEASPQLHGSDQRRWLDRLEIDLDNIRAALTWALDGPDAETALRLASALRHFWLARGYLVEGRDWLERALAREEHVDMSTRAQAMFAAGELSFFLNDYSRARTLADDGLRICRSLGDSRGAADALLGLGHMARIAGDLAQAAMHLEEGILLAGSAADERSLSLHQEALAAVFAEQGDLDGAESLYNEVLDRHRRTGDERSEAGLLNALGDLAWRRDDTDRASDQLQNALVITRRLGDAFATVTILSTFGALVEERGDRLRAVEIFRECLAVAWDHRLDAFAARAMGALTSLAARTGDLAQAARLFGATESFCREVGTSLTDAHGDAMIEARVALGATAFAAARAKGAALTPDKAVTEALGKGRPLLRIVDPTAPEEKIV